MNSLGVTQFVTLLANYIASNYNEDTVEILALVLTQLGDTLATISAVNGIENKEAVTK